MGATSSIFNNSNINEEYAKMYTSSPHEYIIEIHKLYHNINVLNTCMITQVDKMKKLNIYYSSNKILFIVIVLKMIKLLNSFELQNIDILKTLNTHPVEDYWRKYINNCSKKCCEIDLLTNKQNDIDARVKEYLEQNKSYIQNNPKINSGANKNEYKKEYYRLLKIQKCVNNDAICLRKDIQYFNYTFRINDVNISKICINISDMIK